MITVVLIYWLVPLILAAIGSFLFGSAALSLLVMWLLVYLVHRELGRRG